MDQTPYLTFTLHGSLYALEAHLVREIIWLPELTTLTILPRYMAGVVNHRGHIVPVMDLGKRLGCPAGRPVLATVLQSQDEVHDRT